MPWTYRPELDGLRTIAVYLVLLFHTGLAAAGGGFIGVDLFFVLSGFLVSNVILSEIDQDGRLSLGKFYARRVRRLLPAAVVVVVAVCAMWLLVASVVRRLEIVKDAQAALLYFANWRFLFQSNDYFATDVDRSPFLHFWSLSIEEQFYFLFPILLVVLVRLARKRSWVLPAVLTAVFVASLASQLWWAQVDTSWAYYGTDARLYQLLAGVLLAVALRGGRRPGSTTGNLAAAVGLLGILLLGSGLLDLTPSWRGIGAAIASVATIGGLMTAGNGPLGRVLSRPTPVYLGQISYGTYLWHWPVILLLHQFLAVRPLVVAVIATAVSTAMAALSYQVFEHPIRTAAALRRFRWRTVVVGVATSALVAVTLVPLLLESDRRPRLATAAASTTAQAAAGFVSDSVTQQDRSAPVPEGINWDKLRKEPPHKPSCTEEHPTACIVVRGSGPHVTLIGDSQAGMLVPMFEKLARQHDLTLSLNTVPACPWQAGVVNKRVPKAQSDQCSKMRESWYQHVLPKLDPDVVVIASGSRDDKSYWSDRLVREGGPKEGESLSEVLLSTTLSTVRQLRSVAPHVLLLDTFPIFGEVDPLDCLSGASHLYECQVELPSQRPASDAYNRVAAERYDGVVTLDLTDLFCVGAPLCLPVVDGVVVWRDRAHLSTAITLKRADQVWARIRSTGVLQDS